MPPLTNGVQAIPLQSVRGTPGASEILRSIDAALNLEKMRISLFEELVFSQGRQETEYLEPDEVLQEALLSNEAFKILAYIWKMSPATKYDQLTPPRRGENKSNALSQKGIAEKLTNDVASKASRLYGTVRNVSIAGFCYRLIDRRQLDRTHVEIYGAPLLNLFMAEYCTRFDDVVGLSGPARSLSADQRR